MGFVRDLYAAVKREDVEKVEQMILEVGPEEAFQVPLFEDFSGRRLLDVFRNFPSGLPKGTTHTRRTGIHPQLMILALKYSPEIQFLDRLKCLHTCDIFIKRPSLGMFFFNFTHMTKPGEYLDHVHKLRQSVFDFAPPDENALLNKLCSIKENYIRNYQT